MLDQIVTIVLEFTRSGQRVKIHLPRHIAESVARGSQVIAGARVLAVESDSAPYS